MRFWTKLGDLELEFEIKSLAANFLELESLLLPLVDISLEQEK